MNQMKTAALLAGLTALLLWTGHALGGQGGLILGLLLAGGINFGSYWFSDRIVLRMYGARELTGNEAPKLHAIVGDLARRAALPMPRLYLVPEDAPNAFATGRNPRHASVAVTQGLMRVLDRDEVTGVLAHELGHIKNRDTLIMTVAATFAGALSMIANAAMWSSLLGGGSSDDEEGGGSPVAGILGIMVAPLAATLVQMAISRSREFLADQAGARMSGNPLALASALRKIQISSQQVQMQAGTPATAHLCIINPFSGGGLVRLFSTHPPTEDRIARLEVMAVKDAGMLA